MTDRPRLPRQPRLPREPKGYTDEAVLSEDEVQRRVDVRGGGTPTAPPVEQRFRDRRPTTAARRGGRDRARDAALLLGLGVIGLVALVVLLPDGPLSARSTTAPTDAATAAAIDPTVRATAGPTRTPSLITLPPDTGPIATLDRTPVPAAQATATPRPAATPRVTAQPATTPRPTPKPTARPTPTAKPTATPAPGTATVIVVMHVINNSGGSAVASDWDMQFLGEAGTSAVPDNFPGSETGRSVTIPAGMGYRVVDDQSVAGYGTRTTSAGCFRADGGGGLAANTTVTCTVTRNDRVRVLVRTVVDNTDGGTASPADWAVSVSGTGVSPTSFSGSFDGVSVIVGNGSAYAVSQSGPSGYSESTSGDCAATFGLDDPATTCTFTFDDQPAPSPEQTAAKSGVSRGGAATLAALLAALALTPLQGRRRWTTHQIR